MKKIYLSIALAIFAFTITAQQYVHQVLFLNEGNYDYINSVQIAPVTVGSYDPANKIYTTLFTIPDVRFASDLIIDGDNIFIAADSVLFKYNKNTMQPELSKTIHGMRKLAVWNNQLLISRGDVMPLSSYFQVYDKNNLDLIYELDTNNGPAYTSEGIAIISDTAYIAIGNGFSWGNEVGKIGMVNLSAQSYNGEIELGPNAKNPDNLMADGNMLYTLNNKDWSGSSITTIDIITKDTFTTAVAGGGGCGSSELASAYIYYMEYSVGKVARFNIITKSIVDTLANTLPFYGMLNDEINSIFYATTTNYSTSGKAYIMQYNGLLTDSFNIGVSAGTIALDVRTTVGTGQVQSMTVFNVHPNPNNGIFEISNLKINAEIEIHNIIGEKVYAGNMSDLNKKINISSEPNGVYFVTVKTSEGSYSSKLIKQ